MKKDQNTLIKAALSGVLALSVGAAATTLIASEEKKEKEVAADAKEAKAETERCAGIVKEGMNDCATSEHGCAGQAKEDYLPEEWITLPKGTCDKIAGGTVLEGKGMDM